MVLRTTQNSSWILYPQEAAWKEIDPNVNLKILVRTFPKTKKFQSFIISSTSVQCVMQIYMLKLILSGKPWVQSEKF